MTLCRHSGPAEFLKHALAFLEKREAENNLLLGISSWLAAHPESGSQTPYFATVEKNGDVQAAAMMTPPHNLVLSHVPRKDAESPLRNTFRVRHSFCQAYSGQPRPLRPLQRCGQKKRVARLSFTSLCVSINSQKSRPQHE